MFSRVPLIEVLSEWGLVREKTAFARIRQMLHGGRKAREITTCYLLFCCEVMLSRKFNWLVLFPFILFLGGYANDENQIKKESIRPFLINSCRISGFDWVQQFGHQQSGWKFFGHHIG